MTSRHRINVSAMVCRNSLCLQVIGLVALQFTFGLTSGVHAQDWQQWRGPERTGFVAAAEWPDTLDEQTLKLKWKVSLGPSYSTPLVVGERVFTTETRDKKQEVVRAFDRQTGKQLWETAWSGSMTVPFFAAANGSWIRATPAADEQFLYVAGMRDKLVCLDQQTGEIVWELDFVEKFKTPLPAFGFVSSPLLDGDALYVQAAGGVVKVSKSTGTVDWRALVDGGGMYGSAFSSPMLYDLGGMRQLIVQTRSDLAAVDPESGAELWKQPIEAFRGMNIYTPILHRGKFFTSAYGGGSQLVSAQRNLEGWQTSFEWRNKLQGYMSTPVVLGDFAYLHLRNQRFACLDLTTGQERWITKPFGNYWSLVTNDKRLLALDSRGDLLLIDPTPEEFRLLDSRHVSDATTWAHLVVAGDEVYVRALDELQVYQWRSSDK